MSSTWQDVDKLAGKCYKDGIFNSPFETPYLEPVKACTFDGKHLNFPLKHKEWVSYSEKLLNDFDKVFRNELKPNWENLAFRLESDFKSGIFGGFPKVWW